MRAREKAVHEHKHVLSVSSSFPGQEWQDRTAQPRWTGAVQDRCLPLLAERCIDQCCQMLTGPGGPPWGLPAAIDYLLSGLPSCRAKKKVARRLRKVAFLFHPQWAQQAFNQKCKCLRLTGDANSLLVSLLALLCDLFLLKTNLGTNTHFYLYICQPDHTPKAGEIRTPKIRVLLLSSGLYPECY